jgi:hypothetical protein
MGNLAQAAMIMAPFIGIKTEDIRGGDIMSRICICNNCFIDVLNYIDKESKRKEKEDDD